MSSGPGRKPRVSDEQILELFQETNDPVLSTSEVADELPIGRRGTLKRLQSLVEDGQLESKSIGGRNTVWWLSENDISGKGVSEEPVRRNENPTFEPAEPPEPTNEPDVLDVDRLDLPGSGDKLEERREAVRACLDYLEENREAKPAELKETVYPDYTGGYASARSWWKNCVYKGLRQLAEGSDRLEKADTTGVWRLD